MNSILKYFPVEYTKKINTIRWFIVPKFIRFLLKKDPINNKKK